MIEMMAGQAESVVELLAAQGTYNAIRIEKDLAGIERFAIADRK
jgi:release factor glutamine methyltransferase